MTTPIVTLTPDPLHPVVLTTRQWAALASINTRKAPHAWGVGLRAEASRAVLYATDGLGMIRVVLGTPYDGPDLWWSADRLATAKREAGALRSAGRRVTAYAILADDDHALTDDPCLLPAARTVLHDGQGIEGCRPSRYTASILAKWTCVFDAFACGPTRRPLTYGGRYTTKAGATLIYWRSYDGESAEGVDYVEGVLAQAGEP